MENPSLSSPKNPHFFQPLLPGFKSHIKIPVNFFSKHIKGKHEGKTVKLRSDSSMMIWKVKMEGNRLTDGWKKFVEAHDLRIGDFVVFRHEGDVLFHVTALGPSCCELQYTPSRSHEDHDEESGEIGESSRKEEEIEENVKTESDQFSSDLTCFSQSLTASNLSRDSVIVPRDFAKRNGLNKGRHEIILINEEGKSWESEVKCYMSGKVLIVGGWTSFCTENKLQVGDSCTFKLLHNAQTPVFRLCGRKKAGTNRLVKLTPTPSSLDLGKQHLPASFTRVNMLNKPGEIILVDRNKVERSMNLRFDKGRRLMYIVSRNGWKTYYAANGVGAGESLTLELIRGGTSPLLKFVSHTEQPPFEEEARSLKRARAQRWDWESRSKHDVRKKIAEEGGPSRCTRSSNKSTVENIRTLSMEQSLKTELESSLDEDNKDNIGKPPRKKHVKKRIAEAEAEPFSLDQSCFTAHVTYSNLREDTLFLPRKFAKSNGLSKGSNKIVLMNEGVRTWTLILKWRDSSRTFYMRGGWRSFCHENGLKTGDSVTFKLKSNNTKTPLLLFSIAETKSVSTKDRSEGKVNKSGDSCQNVPPSSSSVSENRFLTLRVTPSSIRCGRLYLPKKFTKVNNMEKAGGQTITILDKHGVEWPVTLLLDKKYTRMRFGSGLKEFINVIGVKAYESIVLELVWEETSTLPMFKFCSKIKT